MLSIDTNARLFFSDHRGVAYYNPEKISGQVGALEIEPLVEGTTARDFIVSSADKATHLLVHLSLSERRLAKSGKWPRTVNTDQIILCVSASDGFEERKYPHRYDEINGFRRITFFSRVIKPIKDAEALAEFCRLDIAQAKSVVFGDLAALSQSLRRALTVRVDRYLSALAILCQAYLILHVSVTPELARTSKDIQTALEEIGFWAAQGPPARVTLPYDSKEKVEIMTAQWWVTALTSAEADEDGERGQAVLTRMQAEWNGLESTVLKDKHRSAYGWADIELLMNAVGLGISEDEGASSTGSALEPSLVARAYHAIRNALVSRS
jgi:hypothetical protein